MHRRFGSRLLVGVGLIAFGLLNLGENWHTVQAFALVAVPICCMLALFGLLGDMIGSQGLPESIEDAFGFDGRRVDAQDSTD